MDWDIWCAAQGQAGPAVALLIFESTTPAIQAAVEGPGAAICTHTFVAMELRRRQLVQLAARAVPTSHYYWLLPQTTRRPQALAFRSWLLEEITADHVLRHVEALPRRMTRRPGSGLI